MNIQPALPQRTLSRRPIPNSFIVSTSKHKAGQLDSLQGLQVQKVLGEAGDTTMLLVEAEKESSIDGLEGRVFPNFEYEGQLFDQPFQGEAPPASGGELPRHLQIIDAKTAWSVSKGSPDATSAVTDTGLDMQHPVLAGTHRHNPNEIAGNGVDDDGNGKVDDTVGWDMSDNDNDPHTLGGRHHTHVQGILHAQEGNSGATGVAPEGQSMAIQITGGRRGYSSALMVESYLYALEQGAKSINTSFNIDGFVGDQAIAETYRTLADNDVLLFNSAGNSGRLNSPRSAFEDIVLVASTATAGAATDRKSSFSNYGQGVDIAAPGRDVVSTLPRERTGALSGTSMASPTAMGVDLLVRAAHPDWNRAQRWAQIVGTADNIDAANPKLKDQLGGGRVNAGRALTETIGPPSLSFKPERDKVTVRFDSVFDPETVNNPEAFQVYNEGGEVVTSGVPREVRLLTNQVDFNLNSLAPGKYRMVASAEHLADPFGQPLDGNGDGTAGDNAVLEFTRS